MPVNNVIFHEKNIGNQKTPPENHLERNPQCAGNYINHDGIRKYI